MCSEGRISFVGTLLLSFDFIIVISHPELDSVGLRDCIWLGIGYKKSTDIELGKFGDG